MKNIVITGSSKGLGFEMAKCFLKNGHHVTLSGRNSATLEKATGQLNAYKENIFVCSCDVKKREDIQNLWNKSKEKWGKIDVWINNAGVNQVYKDFWEITDDEIQDVFQTNMMGTIKGTQIAIKEMLKQGEGQIYNMEGFGSDGAVMKGLNVYGTTKRAISYLTHGFADEVKSTNIRIGLLSPGMMATDFIINSEARGKNKYHVEKIFNILGNKPEVPAVLLVKKVLSNTKNNVRFGWLTKPKAIWRFLKWNFVKTDLFKEK
jgi:short-subunit dehydrogenase